MPSVLAGVTDPRQVKRGVCAAGHKALYSDEWGGLPDKEFLASLDPQPRRSSRPALREGLRRHASRPVALIRMGGEARASRRHPDRDRRVRRPLWRDRLRRREGDARQSRSAPRPATAGVVSAEQDGADIPGICGIVKGAILPGFYGIEAGQSAVGDIFKWWVEVRLAATLRCTPSSPQRRRNSVPAKPVFSRSTGTTAIARSSSTSGSPACCSARPLHDAGGIYRALDRGDRVWRARDHRADPANTACAIDQVVCTGGIAEKNPLLMQIYADVTGLRDGGRRLEPDLRARLGDRRFRARGRASRLRERRRR